MFNALCYRLEDLDKLSETVYSLPNVITLKEFITNIINVNIENPHCLNDDLKIFFLRVLVRMISERNSNAY